MVHVAGTSNFCSFEYSDIVMGPLKSTYDTMLKGGAHCIRYATLVNHFTVYEDVH